MPLTQTFRPSSFSTRRPANLALAAGLLAITATESVLRAFPPEIYSFYPICPFYTATGLLCPGCGITRALAALSHGHLSQAVHLNALFVLAVLPALLAYLALAFGAGRFPRIAPQITYGALVLTIFFTIFRNLP